MPLVRLGLEAVLYRNTGSHSTPVLVPINNVKDLTLTLESGEADVTTRGNNGWEAVIAALKKGTIDFGMVWNTTDTNFTAIKDAFLNRTSFEIFCLSADVDETDSEGLRATVMVTKFTKNENLVDAQAVDVSLKPTYATTAPEWVSGNIYGAYD